MQTGTKIAVAGATGRLGRHLMDVLEERGYEAVPMSRSTGVDVVTGDGLDAALKGAEAVIDAATPPTPDETAAREFFTAAAGNLQEAGSRAGVRRIVVVSIVGIDRHTAGYGAAKVVQEQATLAGPIPANVLRATQFHEFVGQLIEWATRGDVAYVPRMRTQLAAARSVAEVLVDIATGTEFAEGATTEVGGPREERLAEMARLLVERRGDALRIEEVSDPEDPNREVYENGGQLPGPDAILAGPTFEQWLGAAVAA
jgi:uncharacterized protein YbjT (DUF2867 family)